MDFQRGRQLEPKGDRVDPVSDPVESNEARGEFSGLGVEVEVPGG